MCDPEWKIKTGVEIFVFIHRPQEDFSNLVNRWRQTQVLLSRGYTWEMPLHFQHILMRGQRKCIPYLSFFQKLQSGLSGV